jgi:hypothetical protein
MCRSDSWNLFIVSCAYSSIMQPKLIFGALADTYGLPRKYCQNQLRKWGGWVLAWRWTTTVHSLADRLCQLDIVLDLDSVADCCLMCDGSRSRSEILHPNYGVFFEKTQRSFAW